MTRILVAYATKHHSTAEIARSIGEVLQQSNKFEVDVHAVEAVHDISAYDVVILGSAVYVGKWQEEAARFLKNHETQLAERDVWLFSSGPTGEGDPKELLKGWELPADLQPIVDRIKPRGVTVFHGKLDPEQMNFLERMVTKGVKAPVGDFRDWDMIHDWAKEVAAAV